MVPFIWLVAIVVREDHIYISGFQTKSLILDGSKKDLRKKNYCCFLVRVPTPRLSVCLAAPVAAHLGGEQKEEIGSRQTAQRGGGDLGAGAAEHGVVWRQQPWVGDSRRTTCITTPQHATVSHVWTLPIVLTTGSIFCAVRDEYQIFANI